jgi:cytochrome c biogenesis protein ResB
MLQSKGNFFNVGWKDRPSLNLIPPVTSIKQQYFFRSGNSHALFDRELFSAPSISRQRARQNEGRTARRQTTSKDFMIRKHFLDLRVQNDKTLPYMYLLTTIIFFYARLHRVASRSG